MRKGCKWSAFMHDSTCESSEEVGSEAAVEYDEENPDYESDEYQLVMDFLSLHYDKKHRHVREIKFNFCSMIVLLKII